MSSAQRRGVAAAPSPTACAIRPQFGSPPCSAALTSGELATARATALDTLVGAAATTTTRPIRLEPSPSRTMSQRELAQRPVQRLAEAQLVVGLRLDRARRWRPRPAGSRCRWSRAGRRRETRSNERSTHTPSSRSAVSALKAASVWTKQSIVANARRDHPGALGLRASAARCRTAARRRPRRSLANSSVVWIASEKSPWPSSRSSPRRAGDAA